LVGYGSLWPMILMDGALGGFWLNSAMVLGGV
jgi:hypothetical protein